jgi:hypothetical protein
MATDGTNRRNGIALGLGSIISVGFPDPTGSPPPPPAASYLLLEDSSFVLLEDSSKIELE